MDRGMERFSSKLPVCNKENFPMWKERVIFYMEAIDPRIAIIVKEGPHVPMIASTIDPSKRVPKKLMDMDKDEIALVTLDKKAKHIIAGAVDDSMLQNLIHCKSAKEMWDSIVVLMEGTEEVRDDRKSLLNQEYEAFRQQGKDTISDTYEKFFKIVNGLRNYGREFSMGELNDKFLRSLSKEWDPKVIAIREYGKLATTEPQILYGKLLSHELKLNIRKSEEECSRSSGKEKTIALKAESSRRSRDLSPVRDVSSEDRDENSSADSELSDGEFSLLSKQFKKFLSKRKHFKKGSSSSRDHRKPPRDRQDRYSSKPNKHVYTEPVCYCCKKPGHMIAECPHKKKDTPRREEKKSFKSKKKEERSFVAKKTKTLSESDSTESNSDEEAFFGLMAQLDIESQTGKYRGKGLTEDCFYSLMAMSDDDQEIVPYTGKVLDSTPLSCSETASEIGETYYSEDDAELTAKYEAVLAGFDKCRKLVKTQSKEIKSLKKKESDLRKEIEESSTLRDEILSLKTALSEAVNADVQKREIINDLSRQLEAEKKIVLSFSKPKTVLPIIDSFSAPQNGSGLGHPAGTTLSKSARRRAAKAKGKAPQSAPVFKKVVLPTNTFDFESTYGHFSRPTHVEPVKVHPVWTRPRSFGTSSLKAPYEEIIMKHHGPFVHGSNAKKAPKVKPVVPKPCVCCTNEVSTSRAAAPVKPPVQKAKQDTKRRYNRFECWCCGKIGHFAIDCWFNYTVPRTPRVNSARPTTCKVNAYSGVPLTRNQGPKPVWVPKGC